MKRRLSSRLEPWLLCLACVAFLLVYLGGAFWALRGERSLEYGEPFIVSAAYHQAQGDRLYAPVQDLPFLHNNYNPLVQTLLGPVLRLTGPSFWPGRALTVLAFLFLLLRLGQTVKKASGRSEFAWLAAALPLTAGFLFPWMALGRVDVFAAVFSVLAATHGLSRSELTRKDWLIVLAAAWIAFAAKQSVVAGVGAVLLAQLVGGRWKLAIGMGFVFLGGCIGLLLLFHWTSGGEHWLHAVVYNAQHDRGALWPEALTGARLSNALGWPLICLVLSAPLVVRWGRDRTWLLYVIVSLGLAFWLIRKSGSHVHYLLESVCALSLLLATAHGRTRAAAAPRWRRRAVWGCLLIAGALALPILKAHYGQAKGLRREATYEDGVPADLRTRIREGEGPSLLLSRTATLAIEEGRAAIFDVADFVRLGRLGRFDAEDRLLPLVRETAFPVIAVQRFAEDHPARDLFAMDAIPGLPEAIAASYREVPVKWKHPGGLLEARFFVPKD